MPASSPAPLWAAALTSIKGIEGSVHAIPLARQHQRRCWGGKPRIHSKRATRPPLKGCPPLPKQSYKSALQCFPVRLQHQSAWAAVRTAAESPQWGLTKVVLVVVLLVVFEVLVVVSIVLVLVLEAVVVVVVLGHATPAWAQHQLLFLAGQLHSSSARRASASPRVDRARQS